MDRVVEDGLRLELLNPYYNPIDTLFSAVNQLENYSFLAKSYKRLKLYIFKKKRIRVSLKIELYILPQIKE